MTLASDWALDRKFPTIIDPGKAIRMSRVVDQTDGRSLVVTMAHGLLRGPIPHESKALQFGSQARSFRDAGMDAIVISPGFLERNVSFLTGRNAPGIILCLEWNNYFRDEANGLGFSEGKSTTIGTINDAVRLGADAVMTYVFLGSEDPESETIHIARNAELSRECSRLGMVRIIETLARGKRIPQKDFRRKEYVAMHARIASEIGCDLIKTEWTGDDVSFREVVEACLVPVLVAGGDFTNNPIEALRVAEKAIQAGAIGVVYGRNVIQSNNPVGMVTALKSVIHDGMKPEDAGYKSGLSTP